ncbi:hypothetical protein ACOMHN_066978 [Nucella lapillus]
MDLCFSCYRNYHVKRLTAKEVLQAAAFGDWHRVIHALVGTLHRRAVLDPDQEEQLLKLLEDEQQWKVIQELVMRGYGFNEERMLDIFLQALYRKSYTFVAKMVVELECIQSHNVLLYVVERFVLDDNWLREARKILNLIFGTNNVFYLRQIRKSAAERPTTKWFEMQDLLQTLDNCIAEAEKHLQ